MPCRIRGTVRDESDPCLGGSMVRARVEKLSSGKIFNRMLDTVMVDVLPILKI